MRSCKLWIPRNLKLLTHSTTTLLMWMGVCWPSFKSRMSSLVLLVLSCRSVSLHHMARWSTTSLLADCLLFLMRPINVGSVANLMMVLDSCRRVEERTHHTTLWTDLKELIAACVDLQDGQPPLEQHKVVQALGSSHVILYSGLTLQWRTLEPVSIPKSPQ